MRHAQFEVVNRSPDVIVLRDIGPWDRYPTITNDAEWVIDQFPDYPEVHYYDSEGVLSSLSEIVAVIPMRWQ